VALVTAPAFCLRRLDYSETSQILQLFTSSHGLIRVIAKGAHRRTKAGHGKFDGGLDLLDFGTAVFIENNAELWTLTEWSLNDGHLGLRRSLRQLYLAQGLAEVTTALLHEHDPFPATFLRLRSALLALAEGLAISHEGVALAYSLHLLDHSGYLPELARCAACQKAELGATPAFAAATGGVFCSRCAGSVPDRLPIAPALLRLAGQLLRLPESRIPQLTLHQTGPLHRLLGQHIEHITGKPLRMLPLVAPRTRLAGAGQI
jgi:DNA repair protein RecO (recombination protein O)